MNVARIGSSRTDRSERSLRNALVALGAAVVLGYFVAVVKGTGDGLRYDLGNVGLVWLVLPAIIGARARRPAFAASLSGICTVVSLLSFYLRSDDFSLAPWPHVLDNRLFFLTIGSGAAALFAAVTSAVVVRFGRTLATLPLAAAAFLEPPVQVVLTPPGSGNSWTSVVYLGEIAVGVALLLEVVVRRRALGHASP